MPTAHTTPIIKPTRPKASQVRVRLRRRRRVPASASIAFDSSSASVIIESIFALYVVLTAYDIGRRFRDLER
jgi:hypothetical protein